MEYREINPPAVLRPHIKCFWTLVDDTRPDAVSIQKVLPDGCSELIFNYRSPFRQYFDSTAELQPACLIVGQMRRHVVIEPTGQTGLVGVRFLPGGAYPFFEFPQHEVTDRIVSLDSAWGRLARQLESEIHEARTDDERIAAIVRTLSAGLRRRDNRDEATDAAVGIISTSQGLVTIESLASVTGLSTRQLERRFRIRVGVAPKTLCRIVRFQRILRGIEHRPRHESWARLASECGYYDQPHFVHEFNQFCGQDPSSFLAERYELSRHFTSDEHLSDFYNTQ